MTMTEGKCIGGPMDGGTMPMPAAGEVAEHWGSWSVPAHAERATEERRCRKVYLYAQDETYAHRLNYVGEDVIWEEVD